MEIRHHEFKCVSSVSDVSMKSAAETVGQFDSEEADEQISRLANELTSCGLTLNQARIYVYLLAKGTSPVRDISKGLALHRVDVYRKLRELENLGLLEEYLSSPKRYMAVDPKDAVPALLHRQEQTLALYRKRIGDSFTKLDRLRDSRLNQRAPQWDAQGAESFYKMVTGRRRYYDEMRRMIRGAKTEVLRIVSSGGITRTFLAGIDKEYALAQSRGVSIRMISEINSQNRRYARRLSRVVQLKHLDGIRLRFTVVDRAESIISARFDETSQSLDSVEDRYIVFKDPKLADCFQFFFEHVWKDAKTV